MGSNSIKSVFLYWKCLTDLGINDNYNEYNFLFNLTGYAPVDDVTIRNDPV